MTRAPMVRDPFGRALVLLLAVATLVATLETAFALAQHPPYPYFFAAFPLSGLFSVAVGVLLWHRRPSLPIAWLLVVQGVFLLAAAGSNVLNPYAMFIGIALAEAPIGALYALVLAFPGGDVRPRFARPLVIAFYVVTIGLQIPQYVTMPVEMPVDLLRIEGHPEWAARINDVQATSVSVLTALGALVVLDVLRRTRDARRRRVLAVVYGYGLIALLGIPISAHVLAPLLGWNAFQRFGFQVGLFVGIPLVFGIAVLAGAYARTFEVSELGRWFADPEVRSTPQEAIARALGDPSVQVLYRLPGSSQFVDADGASVAVPFGSEHRGIVAVHTDQDGAASAVLVYDASTVHRGLVTEAARVLALVIDRDRLTAELAASRRALLEAGRQLLAGGDQERRRIARDLHDSVQNRLVLAAMEIGRLQELVGADGPGRERVDQLRGHLDDAMTELRHVVDGVMPPLLLEQGLMAALDELVHATPLVAELRASGDDAVVADTVATAIYFVTAEALTNVLKHAEASRIEVEVSVEEELLRLSVRDDGNGRVDRPGSGLRGMAGRVAALGGTFRVRSEPGTGSLVSVEVPCGS